MDGVEPIPLERLALVRSSEFPFETNQAGEVIVYPAAEYDPNFVRQSIHFTIGHEVASHTDEWSKSNYLVVSNLDRAIDRNGKLSSMGPVDSWFTVEPHEAVILPDAVIISPTDDPRAELLAQDKSSRVITYKDLPEADYSSEDIAKLQQLIDEADPGIRFIINRLLPPFTRNFDRIEYPINERLRTLSLAIALHQVGVGPSDVPEGGGGSHGTKDSDFDRRISKTAAEHQMAERKHFGSRDRGGGFDENTHNFVRQHLGTGYEVRSTVTGRQALDPDMPLAAKRRLLLSGGIVTENLPVSRAAIDDFDMVF
jgi:hypothetical protein